MIPQQGCTCPWVVRSQGGCTCSLTPAELVEHATRHVIEAQLRIIERLTAENAELRRELGR